MHTRAEQLDLYEFMKIRHRAGQVDIYVIALASNSKNLLDIIVVSPCTGNTISKIANGMNYLVVISEFESINLGLPIVGQSI